jgi:predicted HTH transcriptional regulator
MRRHVTGVSYDESPLPELNTEALDFRAASVLIGRKEPVTLQEGLTLRLLARVQNRTVPTVGGLLLFGQDVQAHFPDVRMQCARFSGLTKSVIADRAELQGALPALLDGALEFVRKHALLGMQIDGLRREDRWSVPMNAVREALVNAVVHADYAINGRPLRLAIYDDRMEIENPGILPMGMTMDDLLNGVSMLRNRVIGRVFLEAGMVEQWGSGVQRMTDECRSYGLQAPRFEELGFGFRVTIGLIPASKAAGTGDSMSKRIIEMVEKSAEGVSTGEIASVTGLSTRAVRARMADLLARGQVVVLGTGPRDPNRRYHPVKRVFTAEKM